MGFEYSELHKQILSFWNFVKKDYALSMYIPMLFKLWNIFVNFCRDTIP